MSASPLRINCGLRPGSGTRRTTSRRDTILFEVIEESNSQDWSETSWDVSASYEFS